MNILLFQRDIFFHIGGGEAVYKGIIMNSPELNFTYFAENESSEHVRPDNAKAINISSAASHSNSLFYWGLNVRQDHGFNNGQFESMINLNLDHIVSKLSGMEFDIIDVPDFILVGGSLRYYLDKYNIIFSKIVTSLHGRVSQQISLDWQPQPVRNIEAMEMEQLEQSDAIYGISQRYINETQKLVNKTSYYIDPLHFIDTEIHNFRSSTSLPDICFLGRKMRGKGVDLFIELLSWIKTDKYTAAKLIGPDIQTNNGETANDKIEQLIKNRNLKLDIEGAYNRDRQREIFSEKTLLVLPARYETFNLVALEALFGGCPVVISENAGICDYLDRYFPHLPYSKIDNTEFHKSLKVIEGLLENYDRHRNELLEYLNTMKIELDHKSISSMYESIISQKSLSHSIKTPVTVFLDVLDRQETKTRAEKASIKDYFNNLSDLICDWFLLPENSNELAEVKIEKLYEILHQANVLECFKLTSMNRRETLLSPDLEGFFNGSFYSNDFWHHLARLLRQMDRPLVACMFELRSIRNANYDKYGYLTEICNTLNELGYSEEATVADLMFSAKYESDRDQRTVEFLEKRAESFKLAEHTPYQIVEDARFIREPKVSVIVSLYNAGNKLDQFLTCLENQTLAEKQQVEVILQDSCSPTNEFNCIKGRLNSSPLSIFYGRTNSVETVQNAWNRGIKVARAPYLILLGADEMVYPNALEELFNTLETNPNVDWVVANAIQTEVDNNGLMVRDIILNDFEKGAGQLTINDSKYIRWNASMYRKSIHDLYGFYDSTYTNAGCTEFCFRVLPHIEVGYIENTLGEYWDYPEIRVSNPFVNEIAQLRSWFIFRTLGGAIFMWRHRTDNEIFEHLKKCLSFRRAVCQHESSDIVYASVLHKLLLHRKSSYYSPELGILLDTLESTLRHALTLPSAINGENLLQIVTATENEYQNTAKKVSLFLNCEVSLELYNDFMLERFSFVGLQRSVSENISFIT